MHFGEITIAGSHPLQGAKLPNGNDGIAAREGRVHVILASGASFDVDIYDPV